ncbi:MAG TPA: glutamate-1-semialdehyde 2,1-aminomutase [Cytophaga sp.]|nr:glutamate-1-semialdehyde 2,1-aminomutase [Cytophaga sp.]
MKNTNSAALFSRAKEVIPGGVNSPVRAFRAVGGNPLFIKRAKGAYLFDEDDNQFIELINSWGPMILGHANELIEKEVRDSLSNSLSFGAPSAKEVEMAELIVSMVPSVEMVRMVNSGTEATMSAIRVARGYTGREKIIKFEGCYHGHGDSFLIAAGSGAVTMGVPDSPGVPQGVANDTLTAPYNDINAVKALVENNKNKIAAIIIEPVAGNMGCVLPKPGFLEGIRKICDQESIVLVFDEVMSGFRLSAAGAQGVLGVQPDMTTMGKIIGGGMPVGAYGGKKEIMQKVSPAGPVYQAGTLSGNPVAMSAGLAILKYLKENPSVYSQLNKQTEYLIHGMRKANNLLGLDYSFNHIGSMFTMFFTNTAVNDFESAKKSDLTSFASYFQAMLSRGIYMAPSQFESLFISTAITTELADQIIHAHEGSMKEIHSK